MDDLAGLPEAGRVNRCHLSREPDRVYGLAQQRDTGRAWQYFDWFKFQFWRFVFVQQIIGKEMHTFLDYPLAARAAFRTTH